MSLLNLISVAFFVGVLVVKALNFSTSLWFVLVIGLGWTVLIFLQRHNRNLIRGLFIVSFYLLGLVWPAVAKMLYPANISSFYSPIEDKINEINLQIGNALDSKLGQPESSLAYGVLFGSKTNNFDKEFLKDLRRTGTVHMVAVSGFNISIIIGILLNTSILVASGGFVLLGLVVLSAYLFLVGFSASVLRSVVMGLYLFVAQALGRQKNLMDAFLFSGSLLLFINPDFLLDLGYQLSFLSLLGVVYLGPLLGTFFKKLPFELGKILGSTLGAQIMILPISTFNFGQISIVSPLSNLLVFWTVAPIMLLSFLQIALSPIKILALALAGANSVLLSFFVKVVELLSNLPWAVISF